MAIDMQNHVRSMRQDIESVMAGRDYGVRVERSLGEELIEKLEEVDRLIGASILPTGE